MKYKSLLFLFLICFSHNSISAQEACFAPRYKELVFKNVKLNPDINFGGYRKNEFGRTFNLVADIYEPQGDTVSLRPVVFLIHGGAHSDKPFTNRKSPDIVALANDLAKRGYVVISPEYRLIQDVISPLEYKTYYKALFHSLFDIQDAMCFFANGVQNGNRFRIDLNRAFMGGVSSGAVITTYSLLLEDLSELEEGNLEYVREVEAYNKRDFDEFLNNKFCGINILGALCLSTTLFDSSLVKKTSNAWLFSHDKLEKTTSFYEGRLLNSDLMPISYGPGIFAKKLEEKGTLIDSSYFSNGYHPTFLDVNLNENLLDVLKKVTLETLINPAVFNDLIFDIDILNITSNKISEFCFNLMGCKEEIPTPINNRNMETLNIYPNPSTGDFSIQIPNEYIGKLADLMLIDISSGKVISQNESILSSNYIYFKDTPKGSYLVVLNPKNQDANTYYIGKVIVQ